MITAKCPGLFDLHIFGAHEIDWMRFLKAYEPSDYDMLIIIVSIVTLVYIVYIIVSILGK